MSCAEVGAVVVVHLALATLLAGTLRDDGTLDQLHDSPLAKCLPDEIATRQPPPMPIPP